VLSVCGSRGSSVSTVSDHGLDDRAIEVRSPAETREFSSNLCVQTGSGAHPASCPMGTRGPFSGGKARQGRDADHSPHLLPRSWMSRSYTSSLPCASIGVLWDCLTFFTFSIYTSVVLYFFLCTSISASVWFMPVFQCWTKLVITVIPDTAFDLNSSAVFHIHHSKRLSVRCILVLYLTITHSDSCCQILMTFRKSVFWHRGNILHHTSRPDRPLIKKGTLAASNGHRLRTAALSFVIWRPPLFINSSYLIHKYVFFLLAFWKKNLVRGDTLHPRPGILNLVLARTTVLFLYRQCSLTHL
jgi:hypothetical protein